MPDKLPFVAIACALVATLLVPAAGQTIASNPRAYLEWMRRETDKDLDGLYKSTTELSRLLDPRAPGDARKAAKEADRVVKLAHDVWSNVQLRKPTRERPKADPRWRPRDLAAARADAELARALVREIAEHIAVEQRSRELDANRHIAALDALERVERIGLRIRVDVGGRT